jgi:hypothetical protein
MEPAMRLAMYAPGTFYGNPLKLLLGATRGSSYAVAYAHFRRDHSHPRNVAAHVGCLALQLAGNFALLATADEALGLGGGVAGAGLATATAALWALLLLATPSPLAVRAASLACLGAALVSRRALLGSYRACALLQAPLDVGAYWLDAPVLGLRPPGARGLGVLLAARVAAWWALGRCVGAWAGGSATAATALVLGVSAVAVAPDNLPWLEHLGLFGWALAMALDAEWLYWLCLTNLAGALQGISHELTKQKATLSQLFDAAHELAHVCFFPALVLQAVHQSCTGAAHRPTVVRLGDRCDARSRRALGIVD